MMDYLFLFGGGKQIIFRFGIFFKIIKFTTKLTRVTIVLLITKNGLKLGKTAY